MLHAHVFLWFVFVIHDIYYCVLPQDPNKLSQVSWRHGLYVKHRHIQHGIASPHLIPFYFATSAQAHTAVIPHKSGQNECHGVGLSWNTQGRA